MAGVSCIKREAVPQDRHIFHFSATMLVTPPHDPMSIFVNGKLKPGAYKVQNLAGQTYLEVLKVSRELCCRPATVLSNQDAVWEFQDLGSGYSIKKVDRGKPDQYCNAMGGFIFGLGSPVTATAYPAAWRVELVDEIKYGGFGYIRIFWGSSNKMLDLNWWGSSKDRTTVRLFMNIVPHPWSMWKLVPVQVDQPPTGWNGGDNEVPLEYLEEI